VGVEPKTWAVYESFRASPRFCAVCGEPTGDPIRLMRFGRFEDGWANQGMYCSAGCRQKAYRQRVKARRASAGPA
jgi:hypothetical protein